MNRRRFIKAITAGSALPGLPFSLTTAESAEPRAGACDDLTPTLNPVLEESGLPALAAGAVKGGRVVAAGAVGLRMVGSPQNVTVDDKFHIGSCTKAMTSTLAGMFVEAGKLKWSSTIAGVFPERREKIHDDFRKVTLEMLLRHRAGLPHDGPSYGKPRTLITEQRLAYMDAVLAKSPPNKIDTYNYSNAGYIIAGAMLERVSGRAWEELMRQRLFRPLEMTSAGFGVPMTARQADQPWGHELRDGRFVPRYGDNHPALGPAGTVHCAIKDYLKFAAFHASLAARPAGLLKRSTCEKLHEAPPDDYALGWGVTKRDWARGTALTHAGSNGLNYFVVWVAPNLDFALAVATNAAGDKAPGVLDKIAGTLVQKYAA